MDAELRLRAKLIDPTLVGSRVRDARLRAGLTQSEVAGHDASTAYISRIEAGSRRPSIDLLDGIALRLGTTSAELLAPEDSHDDDDDDERWARLRLDLDYAELSLRTGSIDDALAGASAVAGQAAGLVGWCAREVGADAHYVQALALEALGRVDDAIILLEDLAEDPEPGVRYVKVMTALSRCYRESGDLARAVDVGERATARLERHELMGTDEGIQLAMTVSGAHYLRGDVSHALRMCTRAIDAAEHLDSPVARASAYWNSSVYQSSRGDVPAALDLAGRAISLLEGSEDARNLSRLRSQVGMMQLEVDPPQVDAAIVNLRAAQADMHFTHASPADVETNRMGLARAMYLAGDHDAAWELAEQAYAAVGEGTPFITAEARVVQGQILAERGEADQAARCYRDAVMVLTGLGADRKVAELWYQLASRLEALGRNEDALAAYRGAAAASGLRDTTLKTVAKV